MNDAGIDVCAYHEEYKKRADEDIELRKFKYGTDNDINES